MKKTIYLIGLFAFLSIQLFAQLQNPGDTTGTLITASIRPNSPSDDIATIYTNEARGTIHHYQTFTELEAMKPSRRVPYQLATVADSAGKIYQYQEGEATGLFDVWLISDGGANRDALFNMTHTMHKDWTAEQINYLLDNVPIVYDAIGDTEEEATGYADWLNGDIGSVVAIAQERGSPSEWVSFIEPERWLIDSVDYAKKSYLANNFIPYSGELQKNLDQYNEHFTLEMNDYYYDLYYENESEDKIQLYIDDVFIQLVNETGAEMKSIILDEEKINISTDKFIWHNYTDAHVNAAGNSSLIPKGFADNVYLDANPIFANVTATDTARWGELVEQESSAAFGASYNLMMDGFVMGDTDMFAIEFLDASANTDFQLGFNADGISYESLMDGAMFIRVSNGMQKALYKITSQSVSSNVIDYEVNYLSGDLTFVVGNDYQFYYFGRVPEPMPPINETSLTVDMAFLTPNTSPTQAAQFSFNEWQVNQTVSLKISNKLIVGNAGVLFSQIKNNLHYVYFRNETNNDHDWVMYEVTAIGTEETNYTNVTIAPAIYSGSFTLFQSGDTARVTFSIGHDTQLSDTDIANLGYIKNGQEGWPIFVMLGAETNITPNLNQNKIIDLQAISEDFTFNNVTNASSTVSYEQFYYLKSTVYINITFPAAWRFRDKESSSLSTGEEGVLCIRNIGDNKIIASWYKTLLVP